MSGWPVATFMIALVIGWVCVMREFARFYGCSCRRPKQPVSDFGKCMHCDRRVTQEGEFRCVECWHKDNISAFGV